MKATNEATLMLAAPPPRGDARAAAEPDALEVDVHDALPGGLGGVEHAAVVRREDAGVVVEDVDGAEPLLGGRDHGLDLAGIRDVRADEDRVSAGLARGARRLLTRRGVKI